MTGDPERSALDAEILGWMREHDWREDDARFDDLARKIFRHQFDRCTPYRRFAEARGVEPDRLMSWREIPAIPTAAFKEAPLRSFPEALTCKTFRTSGTTGSARGALHLDTLGLYEASLLPTIDRLLLPDLEKSDGRMMLRILAPSPSDAPDSSLSHMFGCMIATRGSDASGYDVRSGQLQARDLSALLVRACERGEPVALCGTAFAFVHLIDYLDEAASEAPQLVLPEGSRIMETGGFKGRSREIPRDALYDLLGQHLGVAHSHIVNQYGMTELGSQFYDSTLRETLLGGPVGARRKLGPPWVRVRIIDPETGTDARPNDVGLIVIHDLANSGSIAALESADLGRAIIGGDAGRDGFEVLGRSPDADERGCSIAADALLQDGAS